MSVGFLGVAEWEKALELEVSCGTFLETEEENAELSGRVGKK